MKKLNLLLILFIGLSIISCSSDEDNTLDENPQLNSGFTINGTEYSTPNGYIISATDGTNNSVHAIYLLNGTIINNEWNGDSCNYSNDLIQGVIFNIRSSSITELASGTYNYDLMTIEPSLNETKIATNVVVTDNCITSSNEIVQDQITSGNLVVEISGNIYSLTFTFQTVDFGTVNGTYNGQLELVQAQCDNGTYVGDVILSTQQEVDSFGAMCYSAIDGKLTIGNIDYDADELGSEPSNITSISSLNSISSITDELIFYACPLLLNLDGLNNLTSIGNALRFGYCESLASLEQLSNLQISNSEFDFYFERNEALVNLNGLEGLIEVRTFHLRYMNGLENLQGLNNLQSLAHLDLVWNFSLLNLEGINNVETLLGIGISFCSVLETLDAINSIQSITYMDLGYNPELTSLSGLETSLNPNMEFIRISNTNLGNLAFLSNVVAAIGLDIDSNSNLQNLQGLDNFSEVYSAHITENPNLMSLAGLENLIQVNAQLNILENTNLEDFCSTQNLFTNGSYTNVQIQNNAYNPTISDIISGNCSQ